MRDPLPRVQRGLAAALRDRRTQLSAAAFVLTALACYLYVLVGNINNYDNIVCTPEGYGTGLRSGRWMLTLLGDTVGHAMGNFNLPLFNGLLGLAFLGLACQFLWRALHLQKPWQCAVLTAITAAWPAAASAMLFSFTVHYYLFAVLLAAVAGISLLVGGIGIMNIMYVSVTERTREIGLRMSIGAKGRDILAQFLIESILISVTGGLIGVVFGIGAAVVVNLAAAFPIYIQPWSVLLSFAVCTLTGVFFGWYPAQKAAMLDPIEAIRYE